jgi:hypothetical protein
MQRILGGNYGPLYLTVCGKPNNLTIMAPVFMYTESSLRAMEGNCLRLNEFWKDSLIQADILHNLKAQIPKGNLGI